jgi:hypothetical protein
MKIKIFFVKKIKLQQHIVFLVTFLIIGAIGIAFTHKVDPAKQSLLVATFAFIVFFIYYLLMLYRGVRYDNGFVQWKWGGLTINEMVNGIKKQGLDIESPDYSIIDFGDNLLGVLLAFLVSILISIVVGIIVVVLLWVGVNVIVLGLLLAWIPLYAMARYGIRIALANVRKAKGSILTSLPYAFLNSIVAGFATFSSNYVIEKIVSFFQ